MVCLCTYTTGFLSNMLTKEARVKDVNVQSLATWPRILYRPAHPGLHFVMALEPLVSRSYGLPIYLQEFLIHLLLNHERHTTNLSLRALRCVKPFVANLSSDL
jgi:hypothetical protein